MSHFFSERMIQVLGECKYFAVLTGAGISAESGDPTFRDAQTGLWAQYRADDLATAQSFNKNPTLVWEWYQWRRELISHVKPNTGHIALVQMEELFPRFALVTQNIDNLHQNDGSSSVIELHSNIYCSFTQS